MFYCHGCNRHHDSKDGEYHVTPDGKEYCDETFPDIEDQVTEQNLAAAQSTITEGELMRILGAVKHIDPNAVIFAPWRGYNVA